MSPFPPLVSPCSARWGRRLQWHSSLPPAGLQARHPEGPPSLGRFPTGARGISLRSVASLSVPFLPFRLGKPRGKPVRPPSPLPPDHPVEERSVVGGHEVDRISHAPHREAAPAPGRGRPPSPRARQARRTARSALAARRGTPRRRPPGPTRCATRAPSARRRPRGASRRRPSPPWRPRPHPRPACGAASRRARPRTAAGHRTAPPPPAPRRAASPARRTSRGAGPARWTAAAVPTPRAGPRLPHAPTGRARRSGPRGTAARAGRAPPAGPRGRRRDRASRARPDRLRPALPAAPPRDPRRRRTKRSMTSVASPSSSDVHARRRSSKSETSSPRNPSRLLVLVLLGVAQLVDEDDLVHRRERAVLADRVQPPLARALVVEARDVLLEHARAQGPQVGVGGQEVEGLEQPLVRPGERPRGTRRRRARAGRRPAPPARGTPPPPSRGRAARPPPPPPPGVARRSRRRPPAGRRGGS